MIPEPKCSIRKCIHFIGVTQSDGTEATERVVCTAFPDAIPYEIAFEDNKHLKPVDGDNGIQFEPE